MHVIATAGHVDHGKSALLRALTGMEPDRWAEETAPRHDHRPRLRLDAAASGEQLAFVDVPGHARFIPNMLAGVGPGPGRAVRGGGRRRLDAAVGRAPRGHRRARHLPRPARGHPRRPGRSGPRDGAGGRADPRSSLGEVRPSRSARSPAPGCPSWRARSASWRAACRRPIRRRRSGSGWTVPSASPAAERSSPERCRPARSAAATSCSSPPRCGRSGYAACSRWARTRRR